MRPHYDNEKDAIAEAENMVLELGYFAIDIWNQDEGSHVKCIHHDEYPASSFKTLYRFTVSVPPGSALDDIQNAIRDTKGTIKGIERWQTEQAWETVSDDRGDN